MGINGFVMKYININFPFKSSSQGIFLDLNSDDASSIKADLMHLILTNKGERLYLPDFGTNLRRYIFEQNDSLTLADIKEEVSEAIKKYIPNLKMNNILVEESSESQYTAIVRLDYTITEEVFETKDFILIKL